MRRCRSVPKSGDCPAGGEQRPPDCLIFSHLVENDTMVVRWLTEINNKRQPLSSLVKLRRRRPASFSFERSFFSLLVPPALSMSSLFSSAKLFRVQNSRFGGKARSPPSTPFASAPPFRPPDFPFSFPQLSLAPGAASSDRKWLGPPSHSTRHLEVPVGNVRSLGTRRSRPPPPPPPRRHRRQHPPLLPLLSPAPSGRNLSLELEPYLLLTLEHSSSNSTALVFRGSPKASTILDPEGPAGGGGDPRNARPQRRAGGHERAVAVPPVHHVLSVVLQSPARPEPLTEGNS